jgi:hypothetical protein
VVDGNDEGWRCRREVGKMIKQEKRKLSKMTSKNRTALISLFSK